jgi:hypothetical protein
VQSANHESCGFIWLGLCFVIPEKQEAVGIFGFAVFVQAIALLALVYTTSDVRYRFRAATAPIPIWGITFWVTGFIGIGALLTDLWFANRYVIPYFLSNQAYWQVGFGLSFIAMVLLWLWYAFIRPPTFGRMNPVNFTRQLYFYILQGAETDLPAIASELRRSAWPIIRYAPELPFHAPLEEQSESTKLSLTAQCANDILLMIGSRKFCRHVIASAPTTAIALFHSMSHQQKYRLPAGQFASNLTNEALLNKDSILYHEDEGYYSGYLGYERPFTNALYGDFNLVEGLAEHTSPLDLDLDVEWNLDAKRLEAYCRAALTTLRAAMEAGEFYNHSYAIFRSIRTIEGACRDVYKLDEKPEPANAKDIQARLQAVVSFINESIDIFNKFPIRKTSLRRRTERHKDLYDRFADLMFEVIHAASGLKSSEWTNWHIQYGLVWSRLFSLHESPVRKILLFKLRRLLYEEVQNLERFPNFKSAAIFGFLLNVMGVREGPKRDHRREEYQLRKVVISWARRKYLWLENKQRKVAAHVPRGTISFDGRKGRLIKTYHEGLNLRAPRDILVLEPHLASKRPAKPKRHLPPASSATSQ